MRKRAVLSDSDSDDGLFDLSKKFRRKQQRNSETTANTSNPTAVSSKERISVPAKLETESSPNVVAKHTENKADCIDSSDSEVGDEQEASSNVIINRSPSPELEDWQLAEIELERRIFLQKFQNIQSPSKKFQAEPPTAKPYSETDTTQDDNETTIIKVLYFPLLDPNEKPKPLKLKFKVSSPFQIVMTEVANRFGLGSWADIVLKSGPVQVFPSITPRAILKGDVKGLVLSAYPRDRYEEAIEREQREREVQLRALTEPSENMNNEEGAESTEQIDDSKNHFFIKLRDSKGDTKFRVLPTVTIKKLIETYAKQKQIPTDKISLEFDHESLEEDDTIGDIGIEMDDLLDVKIAK